MHSSNFLKRRKWITRCPLSLQLEYISMQQILGNVFLFFVYASCQMGVCTRLQTRLPRLEKRMDYTMSIVIATVYGCSFDLFLSRFFFSPRKVEATLSRISTWSLTSTHRSFRDFKKRPPDVLMVSMTSSAIMVFLGLREAKYLS